MDWDEEEGMETTMEEEESDHRYAGPEDVACDVCNGRKQRALKSCLSCLVSYCEQHLQPHHGSPAFEKHELVDSSKDLQENIALRQQCVYTAENAEKQRKLAAIRLKIQQRIQERDKNVKLYYLEMEAISDSAAETVEDSEKIFTELTRVIEKKRDYVNHKIRSLRQIEKNRVKELQKKIEQEIADLKWKDSELQKLAHTEDENAFLQKLPSLSQPGTPTDTSSIPSLQDFKDVTESLAKVERNVGEVLWENSTDFKMAGTKVEVLLSPQEPSIRAALQRYSCDITMDPNTAEHSLKLSKRNRKATHTWGKSQSYFHHPGRFIGWPQVLSKESLTGRCYWEVEYSEEKKVCVAVSYKEFINVDCVPECKFGHNNHSWALQCEGDHYKLHYVVPTIFSGPKSKRIGVYLDYSAGILSFYSISETSTLLVTVKTSFTRPLYAGLTICCRHGQNPVTAEFCKLTG
ncbi:tripartite motif-containing protein 16-like isoform X1 [Gymnodraco acuticeps]|uniref:Tripartite motif-containing protein 16-like isoform X1 n=1 Tax=Gymnodraco acuticeps TaxID=8218 RepID=A0A6P8W9D5_GYMAC|nr:tripartite motif-containing protein 16-like isoform X1 [Gymnodraco acuticeps]XP_034094019.1 tripartite motif-containing protein 16-like isoform X1 [Gymnodraco acuticeps]XP_034094020.1 tripartite motif-containing protein 16-like isoform X1 [Gymnodraco acuticeps]XP_034094021.1 tripartite motif-containing protein 16-like isoform X1 [Gymnodraco acuticeps]